MVGRTTVHDRAKVLPLPTVGQTVLTTLYKQLAHADRTLHCNGVEHSDPDADAGPSINLSTFTVNAVLVAAGRTTGSHANAARRLRKTKYALIVAAAAL